METRKVYDNDHGKIIVRTFGIGTFLQWTAYWGPREWEDDEIVRRGRILPKWIAEYFFFNISNEAEYTEYEPGRI